MFTNKKGFTLIEILIVIAIIGILSAAVLAGIGPARNKAKDARIISAVRQAQVLAESKYNASSPDHYADVDQSLFDNAKLITEVQNQGSILILDGLPDSTNDYTAYMVFAPLIANSGYYYCADSTTFIGLIDTNPIENGRFLCN